MNNKVIFTLFFLILSAAASGSEMGAVLTFQTKLKYKETWKFDKNKNDLHLNGVKLSPESYVFHSKKIAYLMKSPVVKENNEKCFAGTYSFVRKFQGKTDHEQGCINGKRFSELLSTFKSIK